jgi:hypothetical protein
MTFLFRKKPVVVEARRYIGVPTEPNNQPETPADAYAEEIAAWSGAEPGGPNPEDAWDAPDWPLFIQTLEGRMRVDLGDWVIKGIKGEFYPCKPDVFEATYERDGFVEDLLEAFKKPIENA